MRSANVRTWRVVGVSIALFAGVWATSSITSTVEAVQRLERRHNVYYAAGRLGVQDPNDACDFNGRLRVSSFDLLVESNQVAGARRRRRASECR